MPKVHPSSSARSQTKNSYNEQEDKSSKKLCESGGIQAILVVHVGDSILKQKVLGLSGLIFDR